MGNTQSQHTTGSGSGGTAAASGSSGSTGGSAHGGASSYDSPSASSALHSHRLGSRPGDGPAGASGSHHATFATSAAASLRGHSGSALHRFHLPSLPSLTGAHERYPDEFIDGGFVHPVNHLYTQTEPYSTRAVRSFICERKLAPFYKGTAEEDDLPLATQVHPQTQGKEKEKETVGQAMTLVQNGPGPPNTIELPGQGSAPVAAADDVATSPSGASQQATSAHLLPLSAAGATKYTAVPTTQVQSNTQFANGSHSRQQIEAQIHKLAQVLVAHLGSTECPICFLFYPNNINRSRCCDQPICSECFIQIKRPETGNTPASCPYCVEPNFGVVYSPPPPSLQSSFVVNRKGELQRQELHVRQVSSLLPSSGLRRPGTDAVGRETPGSQSSLPIPIPGTLSTSAPASQAQKLMNSPEPMRSTQDGEDPSQSRSIENADGSSTSHPQLSASSPPNSFPDSSSPSGRSRRKSVPHKDANVVSADDIRPDYVRRLLQQHVAQLQEQQEARARYLALAAAAAATHQGGSSRRAASGSTSANRTNLPMAINLGYELLNAAGITEAGSSSAAQHLLGLHLGSGAQGSSSSTQGETGSSSNSGSGSGSGSQSQSRRRRFRRDHSGAERSYYSGLRHIGADLEELMIMEAVRQSLAEEAERKRTSESGADVSMDPDTTANTTQSAATTSSSNAAPTSSSNPTPTLPGMGRANTAETVDLDMQNKTRDVVREESPASTSARAGNS